MSMDPKVCCYNIPSIFLTDRDSAKRYFRQFGRLRRLTFRPKSRSCIVEYTNTLGALEALSNGGEYLGETFIIARGGDHSAPKRKSAKPIKGSSPGKAIKEGSPHKAAKRSANDDPDWIDDPEVKAELQAMEGDFIGDKNYHLRSQVVSPAKAKVVRSNLKRPTKPEAPVKVIKKKKLMGDGRTSEKMELVKIIEQQARSLEDKMKILEARDKLIRLITKDEQKTGPTVGTCPDMCPEKERILREIQHQVSLFEQETGGRAMNPKLAIKQYSRSSADQETPLPHELRPAKVLQMTMGYLLHKIVDLCDSPDVNLSDWYHFLWDRTRGIRKDITQQELCSLGSVELVEQCARFHIHCSARLISEDSSVFDQKINTENLTKCLQTLKYMYHDLSLKGVICPNEPEFRAYIVLLNLNDGNFMWEVQQLKEEIQRSAQVQFSLAAYSCLDENNYVKFFKLVRSTTYMNACIMMRYFVQIRTKALKVILKSYSPRVPNTLFPLNELMNVLAFEDSESAVDFLESHGIDVTDDKTHIILDKKNFSATEYPYQFDRAINLVESKRKCSVGEAISGSRLPPKDYESYVPECSFDSNGYLILDNYLKQSDIVIDTEMEDLENVVQQPEVVKENLINKSANKRELKDNDESQSPQSKILFTSPNESDKPKISSEPIKPAENIFTKTNDIWKRSNISAANIFGRQTAGSSENIFGQPNPTIQKPTKGGFSFNLEQPAKPSIFSGPPKNDHLIFGCVEPYFTQLQPVPVIETPTIDLEKQRQIEQEAEERKKREEIQKKEQEMLLERQRELEERLKEMKELQRKKEEEMLLEKRKKEEEMILKLRKEEELKRKRIEKEQERLRLEKLKREKEKENRAREDSKIIKELMENVVDIVEKKIREDKLQEIRSKIFVRKLKTFTCKWKAYVCKNKRKRKALDWSIWNGTKSIKEEANELYSSNQAETLKYMNQYKLGEPFTLTIKTDEEIIPIDIHSIAYEILIKRFYEFNEYLSKNLFWKVAVSLPDENGVNLIENTLNKYLRWENKNGKTYMIKNIKVHPSQTITYCLEKHEGTKEATSDSNGFIFIANYCNEALCNRISAAFKNCGTFFKSPIVILLQHNEVNEKCLNELLDDDRISDHLILSGNFNKKNIIKLLNEALAFLAGKVERPPNLELDLLRSFLHANFCDVWNRARSFSKWNSAYKDCLKNPNVAISLYNECIFHFREILLNKTNTEHADFSEHFQEFLPDPLSLPCDFKHFPRFWKSKEYVDRISKTLSLLEFKQFDKKWPLGSEEDLEVVMFKYCCKLFDSPEKPFFKSMSWLLKNVDPNENFEDIQKVLWIDVVEILANEKLRELDVSLKKYENQSIFNELVVVYDPLILKEFRSKDWFYVNNPVVKDYISFNLKDNLSENIEKPNLQYPALDIDMDLDKYLNDLLCRDDKEDLRKMNKEISYCNAVLKDVSESIKIDTKISKRFSQILNDMMERK